MKNISKRSLTAVAAVLFVVIGTVAASAQTPSLKSKEVVFGKFKAYTPASGTFNLDIPENWTIDDASTNAETIVKVADPTVNAVLVIHVWKQTGELAGGGQTQFLKNFLTNTVSTFTNYSQGEPKVQKDGSVGIYFKYDQTVDAGTFNMWGDAFIQRDNDAVGMLFFIIPKEQYELKQTAAYHLINSFKINAANVK